MKYFEEREGKMSLNKNNSNLFSLDKNLFDNKSTEFNMKNFSKEKFIEKNKNKIIGSSKKKYSLSYDEKNYIKIYKLSDIKKKVSQSKQVKSKPNKQELFSGDGNDKKMSLDKNNINIYMNLTKKKNQNNLLDNNEKKNNNNFFKEIKNDVGQKILIYFKSNKDSFNFKNLNIEENPCQQKIVLKKYNLGLKSKISKNNNMYLNKYLKSQKLNMNNVMNRAKINSSNNTNLDIYTLNQNIQNIIINNNISNSLRNFPNKIILRHKTIYSSGNCLTLNSENQNYLNKDKDDKIIGYNYNSYNYINKIPKNKYNYEKIKLDQCNKKSNITYKNNYINSSNNNILSKKVTKIPNGMKIRVFEYKPLYIQNIISYNTNYNIISQYNNLKKENTSFLQNSFSVGKMKIIEFEKNVQKLNKMYNSNNKSINKISYINYKNNRINGNNYFQRNNIFPNEIKFYDFKPNNIINNNEIYLENPERLVQNYTINKRQKNEYDIEIKNEDKRIKRKKRNNTILF